jgi:hypothetical protein
MKSLWSLSTGWQFHGWMLGLSTGRNTTLLPSIYCELCLDEYLDVLVLQRLGLYDNLSTMKASHYVR